MKRMPILSALLVLAMLLSLLTGCGSETTSASSASSGTTQETSAAAPAPAASEAAPAPADSAPISTPEDSAAETTQFAPTPVALPLTKEPVTYTIWYCEPFGELVDDPAQDVAVFRLLSERTGIQFDFTLTTMESASEKFQLLFAADDLTDIITDAMAYYSGSIDDAVDKDAFLLDYSGYLPDMPNYSYILSQYVEARKTITSSDTGAMVAFPEIYQDVGDVSGYMVRKDFLDATGMDIPKTYDQFHDLLSAIYANTGATLEMINSGGDGLLGAGFGVNTTLGNNTLEGWYVDDGTVKLGVLEPGFKEYVELVKEWYNEGLIYPDFVGTGHAATCPSCSTAPIPSP